MSISEKAIQEYNRVLETIPEGYGYLDYYFGNPPIADVLSGKIHDLTPSEYVVIWEHTNRFLIGSPSANRGKLEELYIKARTYLIALDDENMALLYKLSGGKYEQDGPSE